MYCKIIEFGKNFKLKYFFYQDQLNDLGIP